MTAWARLFRAGFGVAVAGWLLALGLGGSEAQAAPAPVDPLEVGRSTLAVPSPQPHVSPTGEQGVVWLNTEPANYAYRSRWREGGGAFGPVDELTRQSNTEEPGIAFNQQGRAFVYFGSSATAGAQYAIREPGEPTGAFRPLTPCGRFVDAAVAPDGRLAVGCSRTLSSTPPDTAVILQSPGLGQAFASPVSPFGAVYDNFIQPEVAWGGDGRLAVTVDMLDVTTSSPPPTYTDRLRSYVIDPGGSAALFEVDTAPYTATLFGLSPTGTAVAGDGAVVITSENDTAGAKVYLRPAGAGAFTTTTLPWDWAARPAVDGAGTVHAIVAKNGPPYAYGVITRPLGGSFGPVTDLASPRPASSYMTDFEVGTDGTEYALFSADDGPATVRVRAPGAAAFDAPIPVAPTDSNARNASLTPTGDLLVAWSREIAPGDFRVFVGGIDSGARPTLGPVEIPRRVVAGEPVRFSAQADDSMGLRSLAWKFGDGGTATGGSVSHAFAKAGEYAVEVTATDRAGNSTSQTASVKAVAVAPVVRRDRRPARLRVRGKRTLKFRTLSRRGARYRVRSSERVRLVAQLVARPRRARISAAGDFVLAERAISLNRRVRIVRLRPKPRLLGRKAARNLRLQVRFSAIDMGGNATLVNRRLRVRR